MKKSLIPVILLIVFVFAGCCDCDQKESENAANKVTNALLQSEVLLNHNINLNRQTGGQDWDGGFDMKNFINQVFDDVIAAKIQVFDPDYIPFKFELIDSEEIKFRAGLVRDTVVFEDPDNKEITLKVLETELKKEELKILHFTEKWDFDQARFCLKKEVVEFDLVREYKTPIGEEEYRTDMKKVCALHFDNPKQSILSENVKDKILLAENIKYEFSLDVYESWVEDLDQELFLELIMEKVREDAVDIYDFNDNTKKYSYKEIVDQNDFLTDTVAIVDETTGEIIKRVIQYEFDTDMIGSYIFTEDWYYDPDTYKIVKVVKGIAPVLHFYSQADPEMTDLQKKILFQVWFNYE